MRFTRLNTQEQVQSLKLPAAIALDTEYRHPDPNSKEVPDYRTAILESIVIATDPETAYSFPSNLLPYISSLIGKRIYMQNFKCDVGILARSGLDLINHDIIDSMLLHHLIDENAEHSLDAMVKHYYADDYKEQFWATYETYESAPPEARLEYECKDAIYTYRLTTTFLELLKDRLPLVEHVHRLGKALYRTEVQGIPVDTGLMQSTKEEMGAKIAQYLPQLRSEYLPYCEEWELEQWGRELEKRKTIKGKVGVPRPTFNFASNSQIQWLLYEALKLPVLKKTKAKKPATDYETIEKLEADYPILKTYKDYIEIKTIYGTFVEGLQEKVRNGRIYPSFNVNGTVTGRISHSGPNMGNMPKEGPYRSFFRPSSEHAVVGADYSQLEVVIEANLTGDKNLKRIILEGASKHDITAQEMGINRDLAKTMNFAMGYHCGVPKLKTLLKCSYKEADYQWHKYWEVYKGCRDLKLLTDAEVEAGQPITNLVGRLRHFPKEFAQEWELGAAQRQAYNFKIQGVGADFTNESFYRISEWLRRFNYGRALFSVHDEVVLDVVKERCDLVLEHLVSTMEHLGTKYALEIPLKAQPYGPLDAWRKA